MPFHMLLLLRQLICNLWNFLYLKFYILPHLGFELIVFYSHWREYLENYLPLVESIHGTGSVIISTPNMYPYLI